MAKEQWSDYEPGLRKLETGEWQAYAVRYLGRQEVVGPVFDETNESVVTLARAFATMLNDRIDNDTGALRNDD